MTDNKNAEDRKAALAALDARAREGFGTEEFRRETAALITQRLDWGFDFNMPFTRFLEVDRVGKWDQVEITERRGMKAYWVARNGYVDESQLETNRWTVPRDSIGFHVSEFSDKMEANFGESLGSLIGLGERRVESDINARIFSTLQAAIGSLSPYYVDATAGLTAELLDTAIDEVWDEAQPENVSFEVPLTILGRRSAISQVATIATAVTNQWDQEAVRDMRHLGVVAQYRGGDVQVLRNYVDADNVALLPDNELWVFSGTVGKVVYFGGADTDVYQEHNPKYDHHVARQDVGVMVYRPNLARRIVLGDGS